MLDEETYGEAVIAIQDEALNHGVIFVASEACDLLNAVIKVIGSSNLKEKENG